MNLENNQNYMDKKFGDILSKIINHDIKKSIRDNSVFEFVNIPLPIIYFLTFYCFTEKYSLEKSFIEINDNKYLFEGNICTKNAISKLYSLLREKIKINMHKIWNNNIIGIILQKMGILSLKQMNVRLLETMKLFIGCLE